MAVKIATATNHHNFFDRLLDWLQDGTDGPGWTMLSYSSSSLQALFVSEGLSGTEHIYYGFSLHEAISSDAYALGMWMFKSYNAALDELAQPGHSGVTYLPLYNTSMPHWFIANAQRLMIVAKISTTYTASYLGKFFPYGTPGEYGQPFYRSAPVTVPTTRWSTINEGDRNFWDPGGASVMCRPDGQWWTAQNYYESSGEADVFSSIFTHPYQNAPARDNYRSLRNQLDGGYTLFPIVLWGTAPALDIYGELDGAYAMTGFNTASEDIITVSGDEYLVVQNMHRTARYYYAGLKLE